MTGLQLHRVSVAYGALRAVKDVDLEVERADIVAIVGASGSGKSSLLGAIAGIVPSTGIVTWLDTRLDLLPTHERGVGLVFQDGHLFPHKDVRGNVAFGLEIAGKDRGEVRTRVEEMLALVGLSGMGARRIEELSGGERQRVALARSLAPAPNVLLLDEPLSSLDSKLRERLAVDLRAILVASGITAILVTHDEPEARVIASRVLTMKDGRLSA